LLPAESSKSPQFFVNYLIYNYLNKKASLWAGLFLVSSVSY